MVLVEIRAPDLTIVPHFDALVRRAGGNVFMHPAALCAAAATGAAKIHMLLAWDGDKLAGLWALRERRLAPLLPAFLAAPPYDYAFVASPVIDPDYPDVMPAFLDAIARERALPKVIQLKLIDGDAASYRATMAALSARDGQVLTLSERMRPFLGNESERKRSGSTAKKLRQDWNKLSALGAAEVVNEHSPQQVRAAFEAFLTLEAHSWKGENGTALLCDENGAAFARRFIGDLSDHENASVALLRVNGKPIAAQVLLYCGTMAYTWKTAFDATFAKFSPGALLIDKVTDALFAAGTTQIESCSAEGSFMEQLWTGRRMTVDMLVDVGARRSAAFVIAAGAERAYALARETRKALRGLSWPLPKRKNLAVTRT
jgi:CelD/BcsL family acetyltransferase involved in cellulose biosynthesis